ncbi:hypothetical protein ACWGHM_36635 [Streptomyces sp. NPDC054904]|uniref:hypothetical protein n=1 Tax=unclassified Streptomyces TaxID=2593676 RepID=UPI0029B55E0A|nr:hypothetical protein [Streptomyces sp. DK15]MDX2394976.1 hypothetical protein [Streptomyces sp. DK15]
MSGEHDEAGFRFGWRGSHDAGTPVDDMWLAISKDPDGTWFLDAYFIGRTTLTGGAPQATAFAQWLLACPSEGPYEREFILIDSEPQSGSRRLTDGTRLTVEILLGREEAGGPEYLQVLLFGGIRDYAFPVCAPLECPRVLRPELEAAAARLLASRA